MPRVTCTDPEIGAVGMTEAQAKEGLGDAARSCLTAVPESACGWIHKAGNQGFIELVADTERGVLVGATSAGPRAERSSPCSPSPCTPPFRSSGYQR